MRAGDTARALVLLSRAGRPWARDRVSYVSEAVGRVTGCRLSHATIDIEGMTYTFMTKGVVVRPRAEFESRAYEVFEAGEWAVDVTLLKSLTGNKKCKYDWAVCLSGLLYFLREKPLPIAPLLEYQYTCASFVAAVCNVSAPGTHTVNRYTTATDLLKHFSSAQGEERSAETRTVR